MKIRKAILPVAGMGTRFLPATKAQPKEMLPIVDKPVIQYVVEDAVAAGIEEIIFVTAIGKRAIEDHFDTNFELETRLAQKGKHKELEDLRRIPRLAKFAFVRQQEPRGDGHAILAALPFVDPDEPVAIIFGDSIFDAETSTAAQLIETYERYQDPVIGLCDVGRKNVERYGIADGLKIDKNTMEIKGFVEKPSADRAPSTLAAAGLYVITPEIMTLLKAQRPGKDGEIRLADALIAHVKRNRPLYGRVLDATWYDCGNKTQFLLASVAYGLRHPEAAPEFKKGLKKLLS